MAQEAAQDYLAARVLTEGQPVCPLSAPHTPPEPRLTSCRSPTGFSRALSRSMSTPPSGQYAPHSLEAHLIATSMLFGFHTKQNTKKAGAVHATYLITGQKHAEEGSNGKKKTSGAHGTDGEDVNMRSSPFMSSMLEPEPEEEDEDESDEEPIKETTILLVREEELDGQWNWRQRGQRRWTALTSCRHPRRLRPRVFDPRIQPRAWPHRGMMRPRRLRHSVLTGPELERVGDLQLRGRDGIRRRGRLGALANLRDDTEPPHQGRPAQATHLAAPTDIS
jgi:hypothetical protein